MSGSTCKDYIEHTPVKQGRQTVTYMKAKKMLVPPVLEKRIVNLSMT